MNLAQPFNDLMYFIFDQILDDLWLPTVPAAYKQQAARVAFNLAYVVEFKDVDDQPTLASKRSISLLKFLTR